MLSATDARIATGFFGFAWSVASVTVARLGVLLVNHRSICRQNRAKVSSSGATFGSICQTHESCTGNATDKPRPYRWETSTGASYFLSVTPGSPARPPSMSEPLINVTAPGLTCRIRFTDVTAGNESHRRADAAGVGATCATA